MSRNFHGTPSLKSASSWTFFSDNLSTPGLKDYRLLLLLYYAPAFLKKIIIYRHQMASWQRLTSDEHLDLAVLPLKKKKFSLSNLQKSTEKFWLSNGSCRLGWPAIWFYKAINAVPHASKKKKACKGDSPTVSGFGALAWDGARRARHASRRRFSLRTNLRVRIVLDPHNRTALTWLRAVMHITTWDVSGKPILSFNLQESRFWQNEHKRSSFVAHTS